MNGIFSDSSLRELLGSVCRLGVMPLTLCVSFFKKNFFLKILAAPDGIRDLSPQTRDQISTPCSGISLNHQTTSETTRSHCVVFFWGEFTFACKIHSHPDANDTQSVAPAGSPSRAPHLDLDPRATSNPGSRKPHLSPHLPQAYLSYWISYPDLIIIQFLKPRACGCPQHLPLLLSLGHVHSILPTK